MSGIKVLYEDCSSSEDDNDFVPESDESSDENVSETSSADEPTSDSNENRTTGRGVVAKKARIV